MNKENERFKRYQERYLNKIINNASKYLQRLDALPGAPEGFDYFKNVIKKIFIDNEIPIYKKDEKFIGLYCVMVPFEIIRALGARPLLLCSNNVIGFNVLDANTPKDSCPLVKSILASVNSQTSQIYNACDMYVVPLTCDCKKNLAKSLSLYKPTIPLYIPYNRYDDEGICLYIKEIKNMVKQISSITGIPLKRVALKEQIELQQKVQEEIQLFTKLCANKNLLIRGTHATIIMNALLYDDINSWYIHLKKLNAALLKKKEENNYLTKKRLPRILLMGSAISFPNIKLPLIIEEQGGIVVSDKSCLGDRYMNDFVSISNDSLSGYYRALANRYIKPCVCPCFIDNDVQIKKLMETIKDKNIDGVIYHNLKGCITNEYECERIEKYLTDKGISVIKIETDTNDEDLELIRTRVGAFIEMISYKKIKEMRENE